MQPEIRSLADYHTAYAHSLKDPEGFWAQVAGTYHWQSPWQQVLGGDFAAGTVQWFAGGKLNLAQNCLDRHLPALANHTALLWEPNEPGQPGRSLTYQELHRAVCRLANALLKLGIAKGDRVCLYMPMVPEAAIAMLAIVRIGAIHSIVFAGFSSTSLADRIRDAGCKLLITADSAFRGTKEIPLKHICDEALAGASSIQQVLVLKHTGSKIFWQPGRDLWWDDALAGAGDEHTPEAMDAEDPLFILYTSGSTGKPKGIVHTTAGYMVYVGYSFRNVFQIQPKDVYWCTADVGWITGHSYLVYGPLLNGLTALMFEGMPSYPTNGRLADVIAKHQVNILYTAPTAIRALEATGDEAYRNKNFSSIRVLGSVGEPINEQAWHWYQDHFGSGHCPIVDTWWQTETGGILISPLAGITPQIPSFATLPLPGIQPVLLDDKGQELQNPQAEGNLCIKFPWPGIARTTWGDAARFFTTYFATYPGYYLTGDGARRDAQGNYRITGRVDDVIKVSGHRIGTAEVENALNLHPNIIESAVVPFPHEIKGEGIYAFVVCGKVVAAPDQLVQEAKQEVVSVIGPLARPDKVQIVRALPKTRSGKIMRRILRKIAEGDIANLGDTSTLLDPSVVEEIKAGAL